jgi:hypothetical protein
VVHGLPEDFDPAIFVGATVVQVSFSANTVHPTFEAAEDLGLTIEGAYEHSGSEPSEWRDQERVPPGHSRLMRLAEKRVEHAAAESTRRLLLAFDDGQQLRLLDDLPQSEAFHIQHGDETFHV